MRDFVMSMRQIARLVFALICMLAAEGLVRKRTQECIRRALVDGYGKAIIVGEQVVAYGEYHIHPTHCTLEAIVVSKDAEGGGFGQKIVEDRLNRCFELAPEKPVILVCAKRLESFYAQFGFEKQLKEICPEEFWGGRTHQEWLASDREWMVCTEATYQKQKQRTKARKNAVVKISGDLLEKREALEWLRNLTEEYYVTICTGGGTQISKEFEDRSWPIEFGPLGRDYKSFEQRQTGRNVLETNQRDLQDRLDRYGINARVLIPVMDIGGVLCPINGDIFALAAYLGYDKIFILTTKGKRVEEKKAWVRRMACALSGDDSAVLDKIEVVGI